MRLRKIYSTYVMYSYTGSPSKDSNSNKGNCLPAHKFSDTWTVQIICLYKVIKLQPLVILVFGIQTMTKNNIKQEVADFLIKESGSFPGSNEKVWDTIERND